MLIIYTTGVFDLFHCGHLQLLQNAKSLGDKLIVGLQVDESVKAQKGYLPIIPTNERRTLIQNLKCVDATLVYSDIDQRPVLEIIKPDIMVQGGDWLKNNDRKEIIDYLSKHNIKLIQFPYTEGISTSKIKQKIRSHE
jgi:rfaE bifunctional protein nucleotidyltransferase chain/domain